ncbi:MAG: AsmA family protein [Pseudomonadota bacterium]
MNKTTRRLLIGFGAAVLLVLAVLFVAPMFINVEKYKPLIEEKVSEAVGRPFTIGGPIKLSFFPTAGIILTDLRLGGFPGRDFLDVERFEVKAALLPLLSKELEVEKFTVIGPRVVLERTANGKANWEGLGAAKDAAAATPAPPTEPAAGGGLPIKKLAVREFVIRQGSVVFIEQAKGVKKEIKDLEIEVTDLSLDQAIGIIMSAKVDGRPFGLEGSLGPVGPLPGQGTLPLDLTVKAFDIITARVSGRLEDPAQQAGFDLAVKVDPFSPRNLFQALDLPFPVNTSDPKALSAVALEVKATGDKGEASLKDGVLEVDGAKIVFSGRVRDFSKPDVLLAAKLDKIELDGYLPADSGKTGTTAAKSAVEKKTGPGGPSALKTLVLDFSFKAGELKLKGLGIKDVEVAVKGRDGVFEIKPLQAKLGQAGLNAQGRLDVGRNPAEPYFELSFQTTTFSPRELCASLNLPFPLTTADPKTFTKASLGARVAGGTKALSVKDGAAVLDDSKVDFTVKVNNLSTRDLTFDVKLNKIDADRYLPPAGPSEGKKTEASSSKAGTDYTALRKLALDGKFSAGSIKIKNVAIENLSLAVSARQGKLRIDPLNLGVFQGRINGRAGVDVNGDKPKTDLGIQADGVQIKPALKRFLDLEALEGAADGKLNLRMVGEESKDIISSLNGDGVLALVKGALIGVDLNGLVQNRKSAFNLIASQGAGAKTEFSDLQAGFKITDGVVDAPKITINSPSLKAKVGGKIDLGRRTLDLRVEPEFVSTQVGGSIMVPLNIKGPWASPSIEPDLAGAVQQNLEKVLTNPEQLETLIKGVTKQTKQTEPKPETVEKGVEELLKGLPFGSKSN